MWKQTEKNMEWIRVKDSLPDDMDNEYLVYSGIPQFATLTSMTSSKSGLRIWQTQEGYFLHNVTHWIKISPP